MKTVNEMLIDLGNVIDESCLDYNFTELSVKEKFEFLMKAQNLIYSYFTGQ